jgi:hypothetical protein
VDGCLVMERRGYQPGYQPRGRMPFRPTCQSELIRLETSDLAYPSAVEYEFVVQPTPAGHGPALFAGLSKRFDLRLVSRLEFGSGAVAMRYEPRK